MDEIMDLPIREMAAAVSTGKTTAKALTEGFLQRIEKVNGDLNAVVTDGSELALKYAERADIALNGGESPGPLFGIPMTIKDSLDTFDTVTTWGTTGRETFRPGKDATAVGRLRDAGAILLGKTNTPEFTLSFQTDNLLFGETKNPFDTTRTPGGSSGGAAAIIAANASPFDVGTDTGGSIRLPSHFSGICGIKPTTGRIPCTGNALPSTGLLAPLSQPGPMARKVDDLIYLLEIMQGPDNIDPHAVLAPWLDPYAVNVASLKVGYYSDNGICAPDEAIVSTIESVMALIGDELRAPVEARPSGVEMTGFIFSRVFGADNGEMIDMLVEDSRTTRVSPRLQASIDGRGAPLTGPEFAQSINLWHNFQSSMLSYFDEFDLLITPVNAHTAIPLGATEDLSAYTYTTTYNLCGWPGVVIRAGTDESGLPVGIQILARPFREDQCLAMAAWLEEKLGEFPAPEISA